MFYRIYDVLLIAMCAFSAQLLAAELGEFHHGRAVVKFYEPYRRDVVIDTQGDVIIKPEMLTKNISEEVHIGDFRNSLALVKIGRYGKVGFIDTEGKWAVLPKLFDADYFSNTENLTAAQKTDGGKWGYINKTGIWVIPPRYDEAMAFKNGYARVRIGKDYTSGLDFGEAWGVIDTKGSWILQPKNKSHFIVADFEGFSSDGLWIFDKVNKGFRLMSLHTGNLTESFDDVLSVDNTKNIVIAYNKAANKTYQIDQFGTVLKVEEHRTIFFNSEEFYEEGNQVNKIDGVTIMINSHGLYGLADNSYQWILPPNNTIIHHISYAGEGRWNVEINKNYCKFVKGNNCSYFFDSKGKKNPEVEFISSAAKFSEGLAAVEQDNGDLGYMNVNGGWGVSPEMLKKNLASWYKKEADANAK